MPVTQTTQRWVENPDGSKTRREILEDDEAAVAPYVEPEPEAEPEVELPPARTHAEADAQAAARGLAFPEDDMTVKEKRAFLEEN